MRILHKNAFASWDIWEDTDGDRWAIANERNVNAKDWNRIDTFHHKILHFECNSLRDKTFIFMPIDERKGAIDPSNFSCRTCGKKMSNLGIAYFKLQRL